MDKYSYFKTLAEKKRLGVEDKTAIKEEAAELGIGLNDNCPNCYHDAAVQIALSYRPKHEGVQETGEYELCDGIDITLESYRFGRLHVCAANCTPENARKWVDAGIPLRFFKRIPDDHNE